MKKLGYTPRVFLQMIAEHGTVEAVKCLMIEPVPKLIDGALTFPA
jgi:hypothetical protein